jgi:mannose-6-phosphate isomerase-like protein (cupin superfamily)
VKGYTIVNLEDVEDQAVGYGLSPNMEYRVARGDLQLEESGLSYLRLAPGFRVPFGHKHARQEEVYVLVGGSARVKLDEEIVDLRRWDLVRVAKDTTRAFEGGPDGAEILIVGAPSTGPGDAEVVPGWWSD